MEKPRRWSSQQKSATPEDPARRELEHRARIRRPAGPCRPIKTAAAVGNQVRGGIRPVVEGARKSVQRLLEPVRVELEHQAAHVACRPTAEGRPIKIAVAIGIKASVRESSIAAARKVVQ
jgi:hypothetical protein